MKTTSAKKEKPLDGMLHRVTLPAYITCPPKSIKGHCLRGLTSRSIAPGPQLILQMLNYDIGYKAVL